METWVRCDECGANSDYTDKGRCPECGSHKVITLGDDSTQNALDELASF